jgi:hypothetical protein
VFKRAEELKEILRKRYGGELEMWKAKEAERVIDIRRYFGCDISYISQSRDY